MKRANKYNARKVVVDGITFHSKREAKRYGELKLLARARKIGHLKCHPEFEIKVNGRKICRYIADFQYRVAEQDTLHCTFLSGRLTVEDVKSKATKTPVYRLKKKLMRAVHGIEIQEIMS